MIRNLIVYPVFLAITLYLGILFSQSWAVLLFFAELVLFVLQIASVVYQRICLGVEIEMPEAMLAEDEKMHARILFRNLGWLPVQRVAVRTEYRWLTGRGRNKSGKAMTVWGNVDNWDTQSYEILAGPFSGGQLLFSVPYLRIYDYFGIFSMKIMLKKERTITILPELVSIPLILSGKRTESDDESDALGRGQDLSELYDIRAYQAGDPLRQIYWKRSATATELLFREGSAVKGVAAAVFLQQPEKKNEIRGYYFLKLAGSIMYSLLEQDCHHFLVWEGEEFLERRMIATQANIYEALTELLEQAAVYEGRRRKRHAYGEGSFQQQMELKYRFQFAGEEMPETFFLLSRKTQEETESVSAEGMELSGRKEDRESVKKKKKMRKKNEKPALILIQGTGQIQEFLADMELTGTRQEMQQLAEEMREL